MKICLVITSLGLGGAQKQVCDLADNYASKGHDVMIVSLLSKFVLLPTNKNVHCCHLNVSKSPLKVFKAIVMYIKLIRAFSPDIIHSHMVHANLFSRVLNYLAGNPRHITTAHSTYEGGVIYDYLYKITDRFTNLTTNVSRYATENYISRGLINKNKSMTMYNGIDANMYNSSVGSLSKSNLKCELDLSDDEKIIIGIGRLVDAKSFSVLIDAFSLLLKESEKQCKLLIVGEGENELKLKSQCSTLGINESVKFLGFRKDINQLLNISDVFVLSSSWEGFGIVVVEAMLSKTLVVTTDLPPVLEIVENEAFIALVNDPISLSKEINRAISVSVTEKKARLAMASKLVTKKFALDLIADKWIQLYRVKL